MNGYVYILEAGNRYKIGRALDLARRLKTYQTESPYQIRIIATFYVPDYELAEALVHRIFSRRKVKGEWFDLTPRHLYRLKSLLSGYSKGLL